MENPKLCLEFYTWIQPPLCLKKKLTHGQTGDSLKNSRPMKSLLLLPFCFSYTSPKTGQLKWHISHTLKTCWCLGVGREKEREWARGGRRGRGRLGGREREREREQNTLVFLKILFYCIKNFSRIMLIVFIKILPPSQEPWRAVIQRVMRAQVTHLNVLGITSLSLS